MKFIKKYCVVIICVLGVLLAGKSCQSCSRGRQLKFQEIQHTEIITSKNNTIDSLYSVLKSQNDSIKILNEKLEGEKRINNIINNTNDQLTKNNNKLINHINNSK